MDSILDTIKKLLDISLDDDSFDNDIIIHINSAIDTLRQLGVGPKSGFRITDKSSNWDDYIKEEGFRPNIIDYIYVSVKLIFDPPLSSFVLESLSRKKDELEFRLLTDYDAGGDFNG